MERKEDSSAIQQEQPVAQAGSIQNPNIPSSAFSSALSPFLAQQPGVPLSLAGDGCLWNLRSLRSNILNQSVDLLPLANMLASAPQNNLTTSLNILYLQELLASRSAANQANASLPIHPIYTSPALPVPPDRLALSQNAQLTQALPASFRSLPNAEQVQNALATIAAATDRQMPPLPSKANSPVLKNVDSNGGHSPISIYMDIDEESLTDYQCLLRKQIELFEATQEDVKWNAQGRNKAIRVGQVGIQCRHCARLASWARTKGAIYYSSTHDGLYQAAQNMAKSHLSNHCKLIPQDLRTQLIGLKNSKRRAAGGKKYWADGIKYLGIIQCADGLRFKDSNSDDDGVKAEVRDYGIKCT